MADIYETIWQLPESHVALTRRGSDGQPVEPSAAVVLDEQGKAGECLNDGNAERPLFSSVDESLFNEPTFQTFIALLDNYTAVENRPEVSFDPNAGDSGVFADPAHDAEVDAFLNAVFESLPMQTASEHIRNELQPGLSEAELRSRVKRIWFEPFTNRYGAAETHCTGFEHVFIGEDESSPSTPNPCTDKVGGYHSWVKYYLDQQAGKAEYLGHDYKDAVAEEGVADPHVATILFKWSPDVETDGGHGHALLKKPGGFFVGTRPEFEIAIGTVGMYALEARQFENTGTEDHRRVKFGDSFFDLVLHPQTLRREGSRVIRGDHLRTLYPKYRGTSPESSGGSGGGSGSGGTAPVELPTRPHNTAPIRIARALPNPEGTDDTGEWVELDNVTDDTTFDLSEWHLSDRLGRTQTMAGSLAPGETRRIDLLRESASSMMLKNEPGTWILLFEGEVRQAAVRLDLAPASGQIFDFRT